jgi:hypothetical protein
VQVRKDLPPLLEVSRLRAAALVDLSG